MYPKHVAIIMDGNGRWALGRGRERFWGHVRGARVARKIIEHCHEIGLENVTLYAFSTENWGRPKAEVDFLMGLLGRHLRREKATLLKNNIRFNCIGDLGRVPKELAREIEDCRRLTSSNDGMSLTFALSYGGRQEITWACKEIAQKVLRGEMNPEDITEDVVATHLQTYPTPDPDLVIRTSGECRLSNFLPWQTAYSEIYVTDTLWPDFSPKELDVALQAYSQRNRRFGRTTTDGQKEPPSSESPAPSTPVGL